MNKAEAVIRAAGVLPEVGNRDELKLYIEELDKKARTCVLQQELSMQNANNSEELIIPAPYDMAYVYHAVACVWFRREEFELYNNWKNKADTLYNEFARAYNRGKKSKVAKIKNLW